MPPRSISATLALLLFTLVLLDSVFIWADPDRLVVGIPLNLLTWILAALVLVVVLLIEVRPEDPEERTMGVEE